VIFVFNFQFLLNDVPCNVSQQLIKTVTHWIIPMKTKPKMLQHNRLDANSFVSIEL